MAYTSKKPPFNVQIVDPKDYIQRHNVLPVSNHAIYESSSTKFHPDGFFSEVIFGPIGSSDRLIKKGYIDLHTDIITPHLYKQLITLKGYYSDILAGRAYAYFDNDLKDFVKTTQDDPNGDTGYSFFLSHLLDIEFKESGSDIRHMKIELFHKYRDRIFMRQFIVLPAGMRDIREDNGRAKSEDINKLYFALLSLTKAMPESDEEGASKIFDAIRYQIQIKVQQIYQYIADLFDGKGGFAQSKYAARSITYGGRNVITAAPLSRESSPTADSMLKVNEVAVPLFQAMKECQPLMIYKLNTIFFSQIFHSQILDVPLINTKTHTLGMHTIHQNTLKQYTTADGVSDMISNFREPSTQMLPVLIPTEDDPKGEYCLYMVYDDGDSVYMTRNPEEFYEFFSKSHKYSTENLNDILKVIEDLNPEDYVIVASVALAAYGMEIFPKDIDIVLEPKLFDSLRSSGTLQRKPEGGWKFTDRKCDVCNEWILDGVTWDILKKEATKIDKWYFITPKLMLSKYQELNRLKDKSRISYLHEIVPDPSKMRPMTYAEMFYIACYSALRGKYGTATRYPVLDLESISPFKIHVTTTEPSRSVVLRDPRGEITAMELPNYPKLDEPIKASMSMHPSSLPRYDGDHDGISNNNTPL